MSANIRRMSCLSPYWSIACITTIHTVCTKEDRKYRNGSGCIWLLRFNNESVCCVSIDIFDGFLAAFHKVIGICMFIVNDNKNNNKKRPKWTQTNEYCRQVSLCAIQWTDVCVHAYRQYTDFYLQHWSKSYSKKDRQTLRREHSSHLYEAKVIQFKCANKNEKDIRKKGKLLSAYSVIEFGVLFGFDWCVCVLIANREEQERKKKISNSNNPPTIISKQLAIHGSCYRLYWSRLRLSFACLHVTLSQAVKTWFRSRFRFNILLRSIVSMCVRVWILCVLEHISLSFLYRIWIEQRNQQPLLQTNSGIFLLNIHDHHQTKK